MAGNKEYSSLRKKKSDYKTSYATAIVDRFIRTIKEKLERYQKLNESKNIIHDL